MPRLTALTLTSLLLLPSALGAQTKEELIASALRAAPRTVTEDATIVDRMMPPSGEGQEPTVLRAGSNGWICMPDNPDVPGDSPACVDEAWRDFLESFLGGDDAPDYDGIGIGYMLRGDFPVSNRDPSATEPTPDNQWIQDSGPHIMLLVPDRSLLEDLPTSPGDGPWVMWPATPYAHVMIPVPGMPRH